MKIIYSEFRRAVIFFIEFTNIKYKINMFYFMIFEICLHQKNNGRNENILIGNLKLPIIFFFKKNIYIH